MFEFKLMREWALKLSAAAKNISHGLERFYVCALDISFFKNQEKRTSQGRAAGLEEEAWGGVRPLTGLPRSSKPARTENGGPAAILV